MAGYTRQLKICAAICLAWCAPAMAQGWQHIGTVQHVEKLTEGREKRLVGVELTAGRAKVRITQLHDGVLRVRAAQDGKFAKDFSWAVGYEPENKLEHLPSVEVADGKSTLKSVMIDRAK